MATQPAAPGILGHRLAPFEAPFTGPTRRNPPVPLAGATPAPGRRTVTSAPSVLGRRAVTGSTTCHRAPDPNRWSSRAAAKRLPQLLLGTFVPAGPVVIGIAGTIERRRGAKIEARGIGRDPVRSRRGHLVKASGLRRISVMPRAPIPGAGRARALPFLTAPAPSGRGAQDQGRRRHKLTAWARQLPVLVARGLRERRSTAVAGGS